MLDQLVNYYSNECPNVLTSRAHYMCMGRKLYMKYPSIKKEGKRPWSALTRLLSGRIRFQRYFPLEIILV